MEKQSDFCWHELLHPIRWSWLAFPRRIHSWECVQAGKRRYGCLLANKFDNSRVRRLTTSAHHPATSCYSASFGWIVKPPLDVSCVPLGFFAQLLRYRISKALFTQGRRKNHIDSSKLTTVFARSVSDVAIRFPNKVKPQAHICTTEAKFVTSRCTRLNCVAPTLSHNVTLGQSLNSHPLPTSRQKFVKPVAVG